MTHPIIHMQLLPQYRQLDRAKKKEKYEESLNLIQELIDCDDFEDISTLRVCKLAPGWTKTKNIHIHWVRIRPKIWNRIRTLAFFATLSDFPVERSQLKFTS